MPKCWRIQPHDAAAVSRLERALGVSPVLARLLAARGVAENDARTFLAGSLSDLRDPEQLPGVAEAADRIVAAAKAGRRICIYGDYDADGMTATAILAGCLQAIDATCFWYVPDRFDEGYGLNAEALKTIKEKGAGLVVTVDCGIASVAEAAVARELGLELIVTDHHAFEDQLPAADVLVHPRLPGHDYPFGELCGAGVAFKLAWAIATRASGAKQVTPRLRAMLLKSIGLAAVGTVADVVPLLDENRIYVRHGLEALRSRGGPGVARLLELAKLHEKSRLDSEDVAFRVAPRLNATGRMGMAAVGIELLLTDDVARGHQLAEYAHELNSQRESIERSIQLAATKQATERFDPAADPALVLAARGWHPGVIGIVAGRLAEKFHRPVVMIAQDEHQGREAIGSIRSVPGFDVHEPLLACRELLRSCGGHAAAAGLRVDDSQIDAFREKFCGEVAARMSEGLRTATLEIDGETTLSALSLRVVEEIERLAPFGQANRRPVLCSSRVALAAPARTMGEGGRHLQLSLVQHGATIRGVAFGAGDWLPHLPAPGEPFHIAFRPVVNEFRGRRSAEVQLVDWRPDGVDVSQELPPLAAGSA
jgi:single-stranded-DNA-specific exonuclease